MKFHHHQVFLLVAIVDVVEGLAWRLRGISYSGGGRPEKGTAAAAAAAAVGVPAPWPLPKWVWSKAWRGHRRALPWLHRWDAAAPENTCVNLQVLWLKALAGDDIAYEMLPRQSRFVVSRPLRWLYPRLHHQNTLMRSRYLDAAVSRELEPNATLVTLGAGFCTRSLRFHAVRRIELDLPAVVAQKAKILEDRGFETTFSLVPANLSAPEGRETLRDALPRSTRVVFVLEALLVYLGDHSAHALLEAALDAARAAGATSISLCFADRLPDVPGVDESAVRATLAKAGWHDLVDYLPKPGLARHMGLARFRDPTNPT
ncbi:hypothetical protein CTAYLR_000111 [Chrysophaeum taylorii]|uniref:S-adenosyl-L-methionine-dependent methyltransferase n=1 Tax=Chrysophaeum taylorii TaxID=2483200 RepID=A0AAD7XQS1_9STRA|nr:hypothetical protein CTAYLR_000111 [Chrysophaeum taylorii]